ncbi:conserved hypothetical protein [Roseibium sp. TrichSKD4]|uniref:hypothetical protein n=1 Tax=Roseibium sp. TrichSKD4 TaxID=744980 RepID=UPI0001E56D3E|nr:hypothetical protein [Roseibium sp. TrichSKD4]EFO33255.1 conserved hypothetical protein [Roseibium sp. TrichSKD4]
MTKRRTPRDPNTPDFFLDWTPPKVSIGFEEGAIPGNDLSSRLSRAVARTMKDCGKDRVTIAGLMSKRLGRKVTVSMLETYASESKTGHNITVDQLVALMEATGRTEILGFVAEMFGHVVMPARYENVVRLKMLDDHQAKIESQRKILLTQVRGIK